MATTNLQMVYTSSNLPTDSPQYNNNNESINYNDAAETPRREDTEMHTNDAIDGGIYSI